MTYIQLLLIKNIWYFFNISFNIKIENYLEILLYNKFLSFFDSKIFY